MQSRQQPGQWKPRPPSLSPYPPQRLSPAQHRRLRRRPPQQRPRCRPQHIPRPPLRCRPRHPTPLPLPWPRSPRRARLLHARLRPCPPRRRPSRPPPPSRRPRRSPPNPRGWSAPASETPRPRSRWRRQRAPRCPLSRTGATGTWWSYSTGRSGDRTAGVSSSS